LLQSDWKCIKIVWGVYDTSSAPYLAGKGNPERAMHLLSINSGYSTVCICWQLLESYWTSWDMGTNVLIAYNITVVFAFWHLLCLCLQPTWWLLWSNVLVNFLCSEFLKQTSHYNEWDKAKQCTSRWDISCQICSKFISVPACVFVGLYCTFVWCHWQLFAHEIHAFDSSTWLLFPGMWMTWTVCIGSALSSVGPSQVINIITVTRIHSVECSISPIAGVCTVVEPQMSSVDTDALSGPV